MPVSFPRLCSSRGGSHAVIGSRTNNPGVSAGRVPRPGLAVRAIAVLAAGVGLAIPIARAGAASVDDLSARISGAQTQADALGADVQAKSDQLAAARGRALVAAAREAQLTAVLEKGRERAAELGAEVAQRTAQLDRARARLDRALAALAERLVSIYKSGAPGDIELLLDSDGFDDLTTRAELLGRIQDADRALAARVRALRAAVAKQLAAVEEAKAGADAFNAQVEDARGRIAAVRAEAEAESAALEAARASQAAALETLQSRVAGWSKRLQRLEALSAAEAQEEIGSWFGDWAIPEAIVMCESGGNWNAVNPSSGAGGAYQIMPSTWEMYGGQGAPQDASPQEQSDIAAQIWADSGASAWVCAG